MTVIDGNQLIGSTNYYFYITLDYDHMNKADLSAILAAIDDYSRRSYNY